MSTWTLANRLGQIIAEGTSDSIDMTGLATGLYVLRIENGRTIKIIKQ
jgi:hypothetical protein